VEKSNIQYVVLFTIDVKLPTESWCC